jgi:hypothetical protein
VPAAAIGSTGGDSLTVDGCFAVPLAELGAVHAGTLPALFGPGSPGPVLPGPVLPGPVLPGPVLPG